MKDLVLYGAGGMGREIVKLVERINARTPMYHILGFIDDDENVWDQVFNGVPVLGGIDWIKEHRESVSTCVTVGFPKVRRTLYKKLKENDIEQVTLIDPDIAIDATTNVGEGTILNAHCGISVNVTIGNGVFFNSDVAIGHDSVVDDFVVVNPRVQISGGCHIGEAASLGGMCFLNPGVKIGKEAIVAPLSAVYGKVKEGTHVLGNPAKRIVI